jgi:hypothetical protein
VNRLAALFHFPADVLFRDRRPKIDAPAVERGPDSPLDRFQSGYADSTHADVGAPAPSCGGGTGWGVAPTSNRQLFASWPQFEQPCMDRVQDTVEIPKHFVVCEA